MDNIDMKSRGGPASTAGSKRRKSTEQNLVRKRMRPLMVRRYL
jgi:hypothetical protein